MKARGISVVVFALAVGLSLRALASERPGLKQYGPHFGCYDPGGKTMQTTAKIKGTRKYSEYEEQEIYRDVRCDTDGYTLKVPNGTYHVELKFSEIEHAAVGRRVFGINIQGQRIKQRLDIFAAVGKNTAYEVRSPDVIVTNGLLKIEFARIVGSPCIAAMSIGGDIAGAKDAVQRVFYQHINCGGGSFRGYYADFGCDSEPNPQGAANGRQPSSSETNRTSAAAASRRSP
jgi:Malectin domain